MEQVRKGLGGKGSWPLKRSWFNWSLAAAFLVTVTPFLRFWFHVLREHSQMLFLGGDFTELVGVRGYFYRMLSQGQLAPWDPITCGGMPVAVFVFNLFNPMQLIYALCLDQGLLRADFTQLMLVVHLSIGGLGGFLLGRQLGLARTAAALMGLVMGSGGFVSAHLFHPDMVKTYAWVPYMWLFLERARLSRRPLHAAWAGLFWGQVLMGGHVQVAFYICLSVFIYALYWLISDLNDGVALRKLWSGWLPVFGPLLAIALLYAAPLILQLGFNAAHAVQTEKPWHEAKDFFFTTVNSGQLKNLVYFFFPTLEGGHAESFFNLGIIPLLLALLALTRLNGRELGFWKITAAVGAVLMLGSSFGLHKVLMEVVPGFRYFRVPVRWLLLSEMSLMVLAGYGLHWALSKARPEEALAVARHLKSLAGLLLALLFAAVIAQRYGAKPTNGSWLIDPVNVLVAALLLVGMLGWFFLRLARGEAGRPMRLALLTMVALELVFYTWPLNPDRAEDFGRDYTAISGQSAATARAWKQMETADGGPWRFLVSETALNPQTVFKYRLRFVAVPGGYWGRLAPLGYWRVWWGMDKNPRLANLMAARFVDKNHGKANTSQKSWRVVGFSQAACRLAPGLSVQSLRLAGDGDYLHGLAQGEILAWVGLARQGRVVASWPLRWGREVGQGKSWSVKLAQPMAADQVVMASARPRAMLKVAGLWVNGKQAVDRLRLAPGGNGLAVNRDALPMAFFVERAAVVKPRAEYLDALESVDPTSCLVFRQTPPAYRPPSGPSGRPAGKVRVESWREGRARLSVRAEREGWLVMSQADYAGWRASLDGRPAPIRRAFEYMVAVKVPAGRHQVEFSYRAPWLMVGWALSWLTLAGLLAATLWLRRARARGNS